MIWVCFAVALAVAIVISFRLGRWYGWMDGMNECNKIWKGEK
jgi:hypothetical protein